MRVIQARYASERILVVLVNPGMVMDFYGYQYESQIYIWCEAVRDCQHDEPYEYYDPLADHHFTSVNSHWSKRLEGASSEELTRWPATTVSRLLSSR